MDHSVVRIKRSMMPNCIHSMVQHQRRYLRTPQGDKTVEITEEELRRRRECLTALQSHLYNDQNRVYNVCTLWAHDLNDKRTPEQCFSSLKR